MVLDRAFIGNMVLKKRSDKVVLLRSGPFTIYRLGPRGYVN